MSCSLDSRAPTAIAIAALLACAFTQPRPADTSVKSVLSAADRYLAAYQRQLTYLLADEQTNQESLTWTGDIEARRQTSGDLFVTYVAADRAWVAVHDVQRVDGVPVEGHEDIRRLLENDSVTGVARQLVARNAQYNIGHVVRNFNEPTLALEVLNPRRRSQIKFDRDRAETVDGVPVVTLSFKETERPTLVQYEGRPVFSTGELVVEALTGRIRRTRIRLAASPLSAELVTAYTRDDKLDLWLPATFTERYTAGANVFVVRCVSTYTNWRRFAVSSSFRPLEP